MQPSYPGVYIEEAASSVHTIVGVPTSIVAFVGTAPRGPDSSATALGSLQQYERMFGRTDATPLGIAMRLFFQNGGGQALVVRVTGAKESAATLVLPGQGKNPALRLQATSKGSWGGRLAARVDYDRGADGKTTYNLTLRDDAGRGEYYPMISSDPTSPRAVSRLLAASSLAVVAPDPTAKPAATDPLPAKTAPASRAADAPTDTPAPASAGASTADADFKTFELADASGVVTAEDYAPASADTGLYALTKHDAFFNLLVVVPPNGDDLPSTCLASAAKIALDKRAFMIVDPPVAWSSTAAAVAARDAFLTPFDGDSRRNAAVYYPRLQLGDLGHLASPTINADSFPPASALAGLFARTDMERGVWKAPAGLSTGIGGAIGLTDVLTDFDSGQLNPIAINALRVMPIVGSVVWGARTLVGADLEASQWKYVPVRRLALYVEESLYRGTQWVVFEPNDEPLWSQIRLDVGSFMHTLFRQGAFQGATTREAYFVKCDHDTNPQEDIDRGIVSIVVGFAPLKPTEFVIIQLQQISPARDV